MTKHEEERIVARCRHALKRQGYQLEKMRNTLVHYNPAASRFRITDTATGERPERFELTLAEVIQISGIA